MYNEDFLYLRHIWMPINVLLSHSLCGTQTSTVFLYCGIFMFTQVQDLTLFFALVWSHFMKAAFVSDKDEYDIIIVRNILRIYKLTYSSMFIELVCTVICVAEAACTVCQCGVMRGFPHTYPRLSASGDFVMSSPQALPLTAPVHSIFLEVRQLQQLLTGQTEWRVHHQAGLLTQSEHRGLLFKILVISKNWTNYSM